MNKPIMKNHFITDQITTLEDLIVVLHTEKTIFVRSWHKVHPTTFFHGKHLFPIEKLKDMLHNGEFWRCVKKETKKDDQIHDVIVESAAKAKEINVRGVTTDEAAAAMQRFGVIAGMHATIGDVVDQSIIVRDGFGK